MVNNWRFTESSLISMFFAPIAQKQRIRDWTFSFPYFAKDKCPIESCFTAGLMRSGATRSVHRVPSESMYAQLQKETARPPSRAT